MHSVLGAVYVYTQEERNLLGLSVRMFTLTHLHPSALPDTHPTLGHQLSFMQYVFTPSSTQCCVTFLGETRTSVHPR